MAHTWRRRVLACDVDAEAVRVTRANARRNRVSALVRVRHADGFAFGVRAAGPFDLVCANILARPLMRMAPALGRALAPGGVAVLSGFLKRDGAAVQAAARRAGLHLARRIDVGDWRTLVVRRRGLV